MVSSTPPAGSSNIVSSMRPGGATGGTGRSEPDRRRERDRDRLDSAEAEAGRLAPRRPPGSAGLGSAMAARISGGIGMTIVDARMPGGRRSRR
jgi:hypothetical protein